MALETKQTAIHYLTIGTITVPFFYLPFSLTLEVILCVALLILFLKDLWRWVYKHFYSSANRVSFFAYKLFLVHLAVLILLYLIAPLGGINQVINTQKWEDSSLEQIVNDISRQYSVLVQVVFDDRAILEQKISCPTERMRLKDYVNLIKEQTGARVVFSEIIHPIFLINSLSGHYADLSLRIVAIHDEKHETQSLTIHPE
ncbi:MAG: hypothetical protein J5773_07905 [Verrucomicrobia bacterium]|nr:hypothetical protein [Verrucomicrobiota bacterium]